MMRGRVKLICLWCISIAIMAVIFVFSAQSRADSADLSMNVRGLFSKVLHFFGLEAYAESELLHRFVRKCAHAFLYCSLGISVAASAKCSDWKKYGLWAGVICFFYAVSDELHQAFVPGRGPLVSDVVLDTVAAAVGICLFWLICRFFGGKRKAKQIDNKA